MSPEWMDILRRAPLTLTVIGGNARLIAVARQMEREGLLSLSATEGKAFGDPGRVTVWITTAGADAYAREVAG